MRIERENRSELESTLQIVITKEDYQEKYMNELKKYQKKSHLKGFRKGKAPISALKKMYGKTVIAEVVNEVIQGSLSNYIKEEKLKLLGSPLPSSDQDRIDLGADLKEELNFKFDIAVAPEFEVDGISNDDRYESYKVIIPDSVLKEELDSIAKRLGKPVEVEDELIQENDILTIHAKELEDDEIKPKGWETGFTILVNRIANDELKNDVISKKKGDHIVFDVHELEKDTDEAHVKKYILNMDDEEEHDVGNMFKGTIETVSRSRPADINQEFFDKAFGEDKVTSEKEALELIGNEMESYYEGQERNYVYRMIMEDLMEKNQIELPSDFLKRWIKSSNDDLPEEKIDSDYEHFEKNLKWTLIRSNMADKFGIKVEQEEIRAQARGKIETYFQNMQQNLMDPEPVVNEYLKDRDQAHKEYEEILSRKVFEAIAENVKLDEKKIELEKFKTMVSELNEKLQK